MKTTTNTFVSLLTVLFLSFLACSLYAECAKGNGNVIEKEISLESFHKVHLKGSTQVFLSKGTTQKVIIKGEENIIELINDEISNATWEIKFKKCIKNSKKIEVYITLPSIDEIDVQGSGDVKGLSSFETGNMNLSVAGSGDIVLDITAKNLNTSIKGSGDIQLTGSSDNHHLTIKGSGDVAANKLVTKSSTISIMGSGDAKINASQNLNASIKGSGSIYYSGNPQNKNTEVLGSGDIKKM